MHVVCRALPKPYPLVKVRSHIRQAKTSHGPFEFGFPTYSWFVSLTLPVCHSHRSLNLFVLKYIYQKTLVWSMPVSTRNMGPRLLVLDQNLTGSSAACGWCLSVDRLSHKGRGLAFDRVGYSNSFLEFDVCPLRLRDVVPRCDESCQGSGSQHRIVRGAACG